MSVEMNTVAGFITQQGGRAKEVQDLVSGF